MPKPVDRRPHLLVDGAATSESYTYPGQPPRGVPVPPRQRQEHGEKLLGEIRVAETRILADHAHTQWLGDRGFTIELESEPGFDLPLKSFEDVRAGIELLTVREDLGRTLATVFVPHGKLGVLTKKLDQYLAEETPKGNPKNATFVESISAARRAVVESLWSDDKDSFPSDGASIWWEVWLRSGNDRQGIVHIFENFAQVLGLVLKERRLEFPDRTVVLAFGPVELFRRSVECLDCIAELRKAKLAAEFFVSESAKEQMQWVDDLSSRTSPPSSDSPAVCLLDNGVNWAHPLLRIALAEEDTLTCDPDWTPADLHGHGTEMAGLALYGDLAAHLEGTSPLTLEHRLESVKTLPPNRADPELYGEITKEAVARAEINAPSRCRVFASTITCADFRDLGEPSSWSGAVDQLAAGVDDGFPRLVIQAAGNVEQSDWHCWPNSNETDLVHDPGQAWNAVTVGACTSLGASEATRPGWRLVAQPGDLSPSSTTSIAWKAQWPNKPDIVMEGGNAIVEEHGTFPDLPDNLRLLTTYYQPTNRLLVTTGDTSAATALAARMAAILMARYPAYWPETIRALLVHSASWTDVMRERAGTRSELVRRYGFGLPDLAQACWSASNALTLVSQDEIQPLDKVKGKSVSSKDMNVHALPWPQQELRQLGGTPVELRVTLSYFIEPSPGRRGWKYRHRYQSLGLRFAMQNPTETLPELKARVSKDAQDPEMGLTGQGNEKGWEVGVQARHRGSLHSDRWRGTAAELAERGVIVVYPVSGWWKERPQLERWRDRVRYALVVSITTPAVETDIYTPVAAMIEAAVPISV